MPQNLTIFTDTMTNINSQISTVVASAASGMSSYIVPAAWVFLGVAMLVWSMMIMFGLGASNMNDNMRKTAVIVVAIQAAGTYYHSWVQGPIMQLPSDLTAAITNAPSGTSSLDALATSLLALDTGILQAFMQALLSLQFSAAAMLAVNLLVVSVVGIILIVACFFNMVYADLGLALLLGVGPFFIFCWMWPPTRQWFFSWANTALYFVFLQVFSTMITVMFIGIANGFMGKIQALVQATDQGSFAANLYQALIAQLQGGVTQANLNLLAIAFQMGCVFLPLALIAIELRTLVASVTGGSGGSFGTGLANAATMVFRAAGAVAA